MTDIIIIGGGMAGLTAALYALRAGKSVQIFERETFGGQITSSPRVDNYPGLPAVSGNALADALLSQALDLGAEIELDEITALRPAENGFAVSASNSEYLCRAVILATGARCRPLGLAREDQLIGHGISYCALCDGAFHKGEDVAVIGGGNSAAQAAVFLADLCRSVTVIQQLEQLTCDRKDYEALCARENIHVRTGVSVSALKGDTQLTGLEIRSESDGHTEALPVTGVFVSIGRMPDNAVFVPLVTLSDRGFIQADSSCRTSQPGIFAAGDCREKSVRQLTTAAADGTIAAINACGYIDSLI